MPTILKSSTSRVTPYHNWTREELIARLQKVDTSYTPQGPTASTQAPFDFSTHPRRKIALKFCYAGTEYNGLEFQKDYTPLPTVEGVLYDALVRTRLIDPELGFEGCGWEKCGRTDKGVSAAGQVISLWVRSNIRKREEEVEKVVHEIESPSIEETEEAAVETLEEDLPLMAEVEASFTSSCIQTRAPTCTLEIPYIQVLNRVLPPTIRILAWSPVSPTFSARFACQFRHYKYFFPATSDLDIPRMQDAASRLVGSHDFRNLCTIDASKQIENYKRQIFRAEISKVGPDESGMEVGAMHVFDLVGNAFLYNQVRSIMAVLFLVGTGLEEPYLVSSLMNVDTSNPLPPFKPDEPISVVDRRPSYQMADGLPLMLWNCGYPVSEVKWQIDDDGDEAAMTTNVRHQLASIYTRSRIATTLDGHFLRAAAQYHSLPNSPLPVKTSGERVAVIKSQKTVLSVPIGGGVHVRTAKYRPMLTRERQENPSVVNERWRKGRGKKRWEARLERQTQGDALLEDADE